MRIVYRGVDLRAKKTLEETKMSINSFVWMSYLIFHTECTRLLILDRLLFMRRRLQHSFLEVLQMDYTKLTTPETSHSAHRTRDNRLGNMVTNMNVGENGYQYIIHSFFTQLLGDTATMHDVFIKHE